MKKGQFSASPAAYSSTTSPTFSVASSSSFSVPLGGRYPYAGGNGTWTAPPAWNLHPSATQPLIKKTPKAKKRTPEEEEITKRTAARIAARLADDHALVLTPDVETPFSDTVDVVKRLLPYHVFQQPKEDLDRKGKRKADDDLRAEIEETKFALECFKRKRNLEERFRRIRTRSGKRPAPDDQAVALAQAVVESDRLETQALNNEIRAARGELDKIEREKRAANARQTPASAPQYYRYPFPYAQQPYSSAPVFSVPPAAAAVTTTTPTTTGNASYPQSNTAVPVQLPVSSLPALQSLGIYPVAPTTPAAGTPQPLAVLRGASADGTTLSLEINVSLLQPAQVNGLAIILNSLKVQQ
ncbi:hypothetical protein MVEN_00528200 [Mycena venus]|uniref:GLTSCR protein conserved domain-containing protein n=1 Tax=Mycena venus TaxID=2733690 RepID=A0A8H6YND5_9AGAR|nr:hypothetical protein MVEN_00528200 [Mycena venus]